MHIKAFSNMINKELTFILPRAFILDGIIYLITLPVYKFGVEIPIGLLAGTFVMLLNFIILGLSAERAVERPMGAAKRYMFGSYMIRLAIAGVLFIAGIKLSYINLLAAAIPMMYPKFCYTLDAVFTKKKGG